MVHGLPLVEPPGPHPAIETRKTKAAVRDTLSLEAGREVEVDTGPSNCSGPLPSEVLVCPYSGNNLAVKVSDIFPFLQGCFPLIIRGKRDPGLG